MGRSIDQSLDRPRDRSLYRSLDRWFDRPSIARSLGRSLASNITPLVSAQRVTLEAPASSYETLRLSPLCETSSESSSRASMNYIVNESALSVNCEGLVVHRVL